MADSDSAESAIGMGHFKIATFERLSRVFECSFLNDVKAVIEKKCTKFMKGAQVWQKMAQTLFYNESRMFHFSTMAAHQGLANLKKR